VRHLDDYEHQYSMIDEKAAKIKIKLAKGTFQNEGLIGLDSNQREFWVFNQDRRRLFVKEGETWLYLSRDEKFEQLMASLNPKGLKENALL